MALLPTNQRDQAKLLTGFVALALAVLYYTYPYSATNAELELEATRAQELELANRRAAKEFSGGAIEKLRAQAAQNRSALTVMRRLVPTANEVPALLEEVSTAARRAGLDVGGVVPEPVIEGAQFDTYRYTVTIIGGFHGVGEFLANVGSLPRIVAPVQLSIVPGADTRNTGVRTSQKGALASTITLQAYVERTSNVRRTGSNPS
jgi:type IV pilus assembly protein PilO